MSRAGRALHLAHSSLHRRVAWPLVVEDLCTGIRAATFAVGSEQNVPVVDVYRAFQDKPAMFADESHFTEEGHQEAAKLICDTVLTVIDAKQHK